MICNFLVDIGVGILYNINPEYTFYIASFCLIFFILVIAFEYIQYKKLQDEADSDASENALRIQNEDKDKYWESLREKEDFFALWAHQIKTPIAAMRALFDTSRDDTTEYKQELFRIENYVEMALGYIRFDTMSSDMLLEDHNADKMIKQVIKKYAPIFIRKHLYVKLEELDTTILTDEKWFSFVIEQVVSNALKYTNEGGITIRCEEESEYTKNIVISDTGIGVRSEDIPRLFEKGFTGYNGRMDKKASGIGLYLCKGICDKLGHGISLTSEVGTGTSVKISCGKDILKKSNLTKM